MTEKQKIFAEEYLVDLNATRAYRKAYPSVKRDETAAQAGSRMLRNVKVAAYISERMVERQKRTEVTQDRVIEELAALAFTNLTDIVTVRRNAVFVKDTDNLTTAQKKAIASIKENVNGGIEVKLSDKRAALELLGRHLGMWNDRLEVSGLDEAKSKLADLIEQMRGGG